jgi:hypothetical protein
MGAAFLHFMIKPNAPSPCANEFVCACIEQLRDAVAGSVQQRPVVSPPGGGFFLFEAIGST